MITRRGFLKFSALLPMVPLAMRLPAQPAQALPARRQARRRVTPALRLEPNGDLYVAGEFGRLSVVNLSTDRIAKWDGRAWQMFEPR